ncbi:hypothetical protein QYM36_004786 [Artemia franciscana]|uniref:Uncharacterized protein n=1 Tax=Artemia franciscana TaxID=6661 RepID=A0AA88I177_ARTSF|nr:hypothetical protein QYM36_004786 [Artemia franciscana]
MDRIIKASINYTESFDRISFLILLIILILLVRRSWIDSPDLQLAILTLLTEDHSDYSDSSSSKILDRLTEASSSKIDSPKLQLTILILLVEDHSDSSVYFEDLGSTHQSFH